VSEGKVLVVGTTFDYISHINQHAPGQALFITESQERLRHLAEAPAADSEIVTNLRRPHEVVRLLSNHLHRTHSRLRGVVAFDCEAMELASLIGHHFGLPYPSLEVIRTCHNKFLTKAAWEKHGVNSSHAATVSAVPEALTFAENHGYPVILRPLTGTGSVLTFKCSDRLDIIEAFGILKAGSAGSCGKTGKPGQCGTGGDVFEIEQFVTGREFSADFRIDNGFVEIVRIARKIPETGPYFGTTRAYVVPGRLPGELPQELLREQIAGAALALGLTRGLCMVDFMVQQGQPVFLELTPRPGGDCLPDLIRQSVGVDMLLFALDHARGKHNSIPPADRWTRLVGLRLLTRDAGQIRRIDASALQSYPGVRMSKILRTPGHRVILPPDDYDSRLLGHVIFEPSPTPTLEEQIECLAGGLTIEMEPGDAQFTSGKTLPGCSAAGAEDSAA